jgi:hypothetical protein
MSSAVASVPRAVVLDARIGPEPEAEAAPENCRSPLGEFQLQGYRPH